MQVLKILPVCDADHANADDAASLLLLGGRYACPGGRWLLVMQGMHAMHGDDELEWRQLAISGRSLHVTHATLSQAMIGKGHNAGDASWMQMVMQPIQSMRRQAGPGRQIMTVMTSAPCETSQPVTKERFGICQRIGGKASHGKRRQHILELKCPRL